MPDKYLRFAPPVFITLILVVGHFSFGILESYKAIAMVIHLQLKHRKTAADSLSISVQDYYRHLYHSSRI